MSDNSDYAPHAGKPEVELSDEAVADILSLGGEDGFWKGDTEDKLLMLVRELVELGVPEDMAVNAVSSSFVLGGEEYGA